MTAHAGERARKTGTFHCRSCDYEVRVQEGEKIPPCPCGADEYDERTDEPGNKG
jgi:Zn finger protein HypA/HybF involved in hydrogenase expression